MNKFVIITIIAVILGVALMMFAYGNVWLPNNPEPEMSDNEINSILEQYPDVVNWTAEDEARLQRQQAEDIQAINDYYDNELNNLEQVPDIQEVEPIEIPEPTAMELRGYTR